MMVYEPSLDDNTNLVFANSQTQSTSVPLSAYVGSSDIYSGTAGITSVGDYKLFLTQ